MSTIYGNLGRILLFYIIKFYRVGAGRALTIDTKLQLALSVNIRRPIKDNYATLYSSFIFPKGSPLVVSIKYIVRYIPCINLDTSQSYFILLQKLFENATIWLRDTGILNKIKDDELNAPVKIPRRKIKIDQPLSIYEMTPAFLIVLPGLSLAIIAFAGELFMKRRVTN